MRNLRSLLKHQEGSMLPAITAIMTVMIGVVGMAVDMGRLHMVQSKLSNSLDAAGLAAGATTDGTTPATVVSNYMAVNFPANYLGATLNSVDTSLTQNGMVINLAATATMSTTFLQILGINTLTASATAQITKQNNGMELALVLDNTGSMTCDVTNPTNPCPVTPGPNAKINALKSAITGTGGLLDILYGSNTSIPNVWIGVVPFTDMVNIGTSHTAWLDSTYDSALDFGPNISGSSCPSYSGATVTHTGSGSSSRCTYSMNGSAVPNFGPNNLWQGCVLARSATTPSSMPYDISDMPPSSGTSGTLFQYFLYPTTDTSASSTNTCTSGSNPWNCKRSSSGKMLTTYYAQSSTLGPNTGCIQSPVLPMTATRSYVADEVNGMTAAGSTMINLGLAWGWRMLSPNWQGMWGGEMNSNSLPLSYHTPLMNKVVILMTDGTNSAGTPSGYQTQSLPSNSTLDSKTLAVCQAMKNNGIIVYTIGFGSSSDVDTSLLSSCATDTNHYFLAPTNAQLSGAFQTIANQLSNLRVSE